MGNASNASLRSRLRLGLPPRPLLCPAPRPADLENTSPATAQFNLFLPRNQSLPGYYLAQAPATLKTDESRAGSPLSIPPMLARVSSIPVVTRHDCGEVFRISLLFLINFPQFSPQSWRERSGICHATSPKCVTRPANPPATARPPLPP